MDMSTNEKKRRRLGEDEALEDGSGRQPTVALDAIHKDQDVWLPDGNIVMVAQNVAFRVHKSVLALHSEVFQDLFLVSSTPAPNLNSPEPTETIDGCPVVKVSDDPNDLRHLLLVLCCGKNYYYQDDDVQAVPFDVLDALIRMAHKYCVRTVLRDALSRLQKYYSNDPSAWLDDDKRAKYVAAPEPRSAIQTITLLAPLTKTPSLLPAAFLTCCSRIEALIAECSTSSPSTSGSGAARGTAMGPEDIMRVINGSAALTRAGVDHIVEIATAIPTKKCVAEMANAILAKKCVADSSCARVAREALAAHEKDGSLNEMQNYTAAFQPVFAWFWSTGSAKLCAPCRALSKRKDEERCREAWLKLPAMLNIEVPGWPARTELPA